MLKNRVSRIAPDWLRNQRFLSHWLSLELKEVRSEPA